MVLCSVTERTQHVTERGDSETVMGLYLAIFDDGQEVDGVEVSSYSDFGAFRDAVIKHLENGQAGSQFPTLILHSDCDGRWTPSEAVSLQHELVIISARFREPPPIPLNVDWQKHVAKTFGIRRDTVYDCFFDVDGESLLERLTSLAKMSQEGNLPILLQ